MARRIRRPVPRRRNLKPTVPSNVDTEVLKKFEVARNGMVKLLDDVSYTIDGDEKPTTRSGILNAVVRPIVRDILRDINSRGENASFDRIHQRFRELTGAPISYPLFKRMLDAIGVKISRTPTVQS